MSDTTPLARDLALLRSLAAQVLSEQVGDEHVRTLAELLDRLEQPADAALTARLADLTGTEARILARALTLELDLANLAEDRQRVRELSRRERAADPAPRPEGIAAYLAELAAAGWSAERVQGLLDSLRIERVLTAHPTEAKRRTARAKLRAVRQALVTSDHPDLLPAEGRRVEQELLATITGMWQTDLLRARRPTVLEEVRNGLFFAHTLWDVVPVLYRELHEALTACWPGHDFRLPAFLSFGSWIGGDRDGNPFVTAEVTADTLALHRRGALDLHLQRCRQAAILLSPSERQVPSSPELRAAVADALVRWPALEPLLAPFSPREIVRRWLRVVEWRLEQARGCCHVDDAEQPGAYRRGAELVADLVLLADSLAANKGARLAAAELADWLWQARTFGLHLLRLDCRQNTAVLSEVMAAVCAHLGLCPDFRALDEKQRRELLDRSLPWHNWLPAEALPPDSLAPVARETLAQFRLLSRVVQRFGDEVLGHYVISMTHRVSDVLTVLWLGRWAGLGLRDDQPSPLRIVPLFETLDDLRGGGGIFESLLDHPLYAHHVRLQGAEQTIMVGYSDSTKDAGYVAANWALHEAQVELRRVADRHAVRVIFFHGRGGGLGRGGGPAARSILSLPPETVAGGLRVTEQGEVLAERYDDPRIAHRHLEQVIGAVLRVSGAEHPPLPAAWTVAMSELCAVSLRAYRELVTHPEFLAYFEQATPIEVIERLPLGSRPARRSGQRSLTDLRAIPWAFAWTQSRHLLPAWYGLGSALLAGDEALLAVMYRDWPFFAAMLDNAALAVRAADPAVIAAYATLADGTGLGTLVLAEHERTVAGILRTTGAESLLPSTPWLESEIAARSPRVGLLNRLQIEALRRLRALDPEAEPDLAERLEDLARLTIQGIAAGMRSTG